MEAMLHRSIAAFAHQSMDGLLDNADLPSSRKVLDVGGGSGTTASRIAERHPHLTVTVFDLPTVTGLAHRTVPDGVASQVLFHAGDMFTDEFPSGMDTILFSSVLDVFSEERILQLLGKAYDALSSGGRVLIYSFNTAADEAGGVLAAQLSLFLNVVATGEGMAYPAADYENWLKKAGFDKVVAIEGLPLEHGLIIGTKN
jgi:cyclopropane fatty-acyl-phospholipid synthase-like methyltransferase